MPTKSIVGLPFFSSFFFFFLTPDSAPSARRILLFGLSPVTPSSDFRLTFDFGSSAFSSPATLPGSSTTKRYLHLGQSTFFPAMLASLIGTIASQLGHCCLNCVEEAIRNLRERWPTPEYLRADGLLFRVTLNHTGRPPDNAKRICRGFGMIFGKTR